MKRLRIIRKRGELAVLDLDAKRILPGVRAVEIDLEVDAPAILRLELVETPGALEIEADVEVGEDEEDLVEETEGDEAAESLRASHPGRRPARDLDE